ncbi:MAG: hypothetical protein AAGI72_23620 [Pseudomonadota bacterium]
MNDEQRGPDTRYRSRKFVVTCAAGLLASIFLAAGKITGDEWTKISLMCLGAYTAGNVLAGRSAARA